MQLLAVCECYMKQRFHYHGFPLGCMGFGVLWGEEFIFSGKVLCTVPVHPPLSFPLVSICNYVCHNQEITVVRIC